MSPRLPRMGATLFENHATQFSGGHTRVKRKMNPAFGDRLPGSGCILSM